MGKRESTILEAIFNGQKCDFKDMIYLYAKTPSKKTTCALKKSFSQEYLMLKASSLSEIMANLFRQKKTDLNVKGCLIVGTGFSGSSAAYHLVDELFAEPRIDIAMVEAVPSRRFAGVAYNSNDNPSYLQTNTPALAMSITEDRPHHFSSWLRRYDGFSEEPRAEQVIERVTYADYLADAVSQKAQKHKCNGGKFSVLSGKVVDVQQKGKKVRAQFEDGKIAEARHIVVAAGNSMRKQLPCVTDDLLSHCGFSRYYLNGMSQPERAKLSYLPENAKVLVLGTLLSGDDVVRTMLRTTNIGHVTTVSRRGFRHQSYDEKILPARRNEYAIPFPGAFYLFGRGNDDALVQEVAEEFRKLTGFKPNFETGEIERDFLQPLRKRFGQAYGTDEVLASWEARLRFLHNDEYPLKDIFGRHGSMINALRVHAGQDGSKEVSRAMKQGKVTLKRATIHAIEPDTHLGHGLKVIFADSAGSEEAEHFDAVISALGPRYDYENGGDSLMTSILERGYTTPHATGIGVNTTHKYQLPDAKRISVVGPASSGVTMLKYGVIGPPAFSVPGMRPGIRSAMKQIVHDFR